MSEQSLHSLLDGLTPGVANGVAVTGLSLDSRQVQSGDLFLALGGATAHGLEYLPQALDAGAAAVAWEPAPGLSEPDAPVPTFAIPGLRFKAGHVADRFYAEPSADLRVVGITGTNGKTSCSYLLAQALNNAGQRAGVIGTLGAGLVDRIEPGERTTPDAVQVHRHLRRMLDEGARAVVMEVSSHALMQGRVIGVRFELALFTNLSRDHLDYHGDMVRYGDAKRRLFDWPGLQTAVINVDDAFGRELSRQPGGDVRCLHYSLQDAGADIKASNLELHQDGLHFDLHTPEGTAPLHSPLLGRFNAGNLLAVAGCLHAFGWDAATIAKHLRDLKPVPGRMQRVSTHSDQPLVVIDYAHTPDALAQALGALKSHTQGKLIVVFGAGGERDAGKRPQMGRVAERLADRVVLTDDNPRGEDAMGIIEQIQRGMERPESAQVIQPRADAVATAVQQAQADDVVLLAGKGVEACQDIGTRRLPYSERDAALAALEGANHEG